MLISPHHNLLYPQFSDAVNGHSNLPVVQRTPLHRIARVILLNVIRPCHTSVKNCSLFHYSKSQSPWTGPHTLHDFSITSLISFLLFKSFRHWLFHWLLPLPRILFPQFPNMATSLLPLIFFL